MMFATSALLLAAAGLLFAVSISLEFRLKSRAPEQSALLVQSNPTWMTDKVRFLIIGALILTPYSYKFMAFAVLLLVMGAAMIAQHRTLLLPGADPTFVKRWTGTSFLFLLAGAALIGALYVSALFPGNGS
jgi:hypothetical protein